MTDPLIQALLDPWTRGEGVRLLAEIAPIALPLALWAAVKPLRKRGEALLVLFSLFAALHGVFRACDLVFGWPLAAVRLLWPASPFLIKLGFAHAASGVGLLLCLALRKPEWAKGLLTAMALYAGASALYHLVQALGGGTVEPSHPGPALFHDILFAALVPWILRRSRYGGRAVYYVPE
jgi:hypothetical protein